MKYVGITSRKPSKRWCGGLGYKKQTRFYNAIVAHGWDAFEHEIVASGLTIEEAANMERDLIEKYRATEREYGYNRSTGGESGAAGVEKSEKARQAASNALKRLWKEDPQFREKCRLITQRLNEDEEIRRKRAKAMIGREVKPETRAKISTANKGKPLPPFSEDHIRRMKENHAGGAEKKVVICVETGEEFASINEAARAVGINKKLISCCCRRVPHYNSAGGFHWKFAGA